MAMPGFVHKLGLDKQNAWISGVCAGFARLINIDLKLCRLCTFIAALFFTKWIIAAYVVAWFALDER
ncbi:MAG: PspC domain-containing protein [Pseudomonadales bacterium]|nr:PspC domain-containing protein [Pseudomonadales bacterium]